MRPSQGWALRKGNAFFFKIFLNHRSEFGNDFLKAAVLGVGEAWQETEDGLSKLKPEAQGQVKSTVLNCCN